MATEGSLNQSISKAHRHYSSLFFLPSFRKAVVGVAVMCLTAGASTVILNRSVEGLAVGFTSLHGDNDS